MGPAAVACASPAPPPAGVLMAGASGLFEWGSVEDPPRDRRRWGSDTNGPGRLGVRDTSADGVALQLTGGARGQQADWNKEPFRARPKLLRALRLISQIALRHHRPVRILRLTNNCRTRRLAGRRPRFS